MKKYSVVNPESYAVALEDLLRAKIGEFGCIKDGKECAFLAKTKRGPQCVAYGNRVHLILMFTCPRVVVNNTLRALREEDEANEEPQNQCG